MREENSFHHPITHQPENIGQIWDSCSIGIVVFGFFSFGRQESPSEQCSNSSAIPPYWLFNRGFPNWILIIRNIFGSIINYNSVQSLHFSQPTGVFLSLLIWDFPNPRYIFESILKEEVPQNLCSFRCSFRLTIGSTGHVLSDQILHRSSSEAKWTPSFMGTGKKSQRGKYMLLHCICNKYMAFCNIWQLHHGFCSHCHGFFLPTNPARKFSGDSLGMVDGQFTTSTSCFLQV